MACMAQQRDRGGKVQDSRTSRTGSRGVRHRAMDVPGAQPGRRSPGGRDGIPHHHHPPSPHPPSINTTTRNSHPGICRQHDADAGPPAKICLI
ncbi:hypothetical protein LZ31DRAFT_255029 [Colletotrichum somersetense]|nr:hypothetical protein LZ31DRAFT_255029 [Colletotrichum somersetense]